MHCQHLERGLVKLKNREETHFKLNYGSSCKRQEDSEPHAVAKLSHLLAIQTIRTMGPVSVNSGESESSHPP